MIIRGQSHVLANGGLEWLAWLTEFEPSSGPAPYAALAAVGSKLSIAWIRGPFFRPDGSASLVGADSLVVITKKKLSAMFALWSLCDEHRYDWLRTLANLLAQHYLKRETLQSSRRGTVRSTSRDLPIADHVSTLALWSCQHSPNPGEHPTGLGKKLGKSSCPGRNGTGGLLVKPTCDTHKYHWHVPYHNCITSRSLPYWRLKT